MFSAMGIFYHHDAITGTDAQFVDQDYVFKLWKAQQKNNEEYKSILAEDMKKYTGIKANPSDIVTCIGSQNDTVS